NDVVPLDSSRSRKRNSSGSTSCDSAPNESAVEAYYSEFLVLQKDPIVKQMLSNPSEDFYFLNLNHSVSRFSPKQNSKMIDFWGPAVKTQKRPHRPHTAIRVSRGNRMTFDRRQFVTALLASAAVPAPTIDGNRPSFSPATSLSNPPDTKVDFRYAPHHQQSTI